MAKPSPASVGTAEYILRLNDSASAAFAYPTNGTRNNPVLALVLMTQLISSITATPIIAAEVPAGATSCSGCHPASDGVNTAVPRLAGQDAAKTIAAMQAFRNGGRPATVMDRIAKGFSDDEIKSIADWYAAQR